MNPFADRMRSLTEHLTVSIRDRGESLTRVHEATDGILGAARSFMHDVAEQHQEMAEDLRETMTANRAERCQNVAELRHRHRESLNKAAAEVRRILGDARKARLESVSQMKQGFHKDQNALARDLQAAAGLWQAFAGRTAVGDVAVEEFVEQRPVAKGPQAKPKVETPRGRKPGRPRTAKKSRPAHKAHSKSR